MRERLETVLWGGGVGSWGPWEARLCPPTHHPLGVLGRAHFFGVASDLQRKRGLGTHVGQPRAAV